jgi:DNA-binding PadR family transcriptional regulator
MSCSDMSLCDIYAKDAMETLPLTEATFFILLSLAPGARHGYAIIKDVESLSEGRVVFSTGTLYGAIKRLLEEGYITRADTQEHYERGRKDYWLTDLGRRILAQEIQRLRTLASIGALRLQGAE